MAIQALAGRVLPCGPSSVTVVRRTTRLNSTPSRSITRSTVCLRRRLSPRGGSRQPPGFLYAVKASRFLTHMKKLKDPAEPLHRLFQRAQRLQRTFGPVLYQLPPHWPANIERLSAFVRALPKRRQHVIEFREPSWYNDEVFELLERKGIALCLHDMAGSADRQNGGRPVRLCALPRAGQIHGSLR